MQRRDRVVIATDPITIPAQANGITLLNTVPLAIAELLRLQAIPSSVRVVNLAGEALQLRLVQQLYAQTSTERVLQILWSIRRHDLFVLYVCRRARKHCPHWASDLEHGGSMYWTGVWSLFRGRCGKPYVAGVGLRAVMWGGRG